MGVVQPRGCHVGKEELVVVDKEGGVSYTSHWEVAYVGVAYVGVACVGVALMEDQRNEDHSYGMDTFHGDEEVQEWW